MLVNVSGFPLHNHFVDSVNKAECRPATMALWQWMGLSLMSVQRDKTTMQIQLEKGVRSGYSSQVHPVFTTAEAHREFDKCAQRLL